MTALVDKMQKDKAEAEAQRDQILRVSAQKDTDAKDNKNAEKQEAKPEPKAEEKRIQSDKRDEAEKADKPELKDEEAESLTKEAGESADSKDQAESTEATLRKEVERLRKEQQRVAGQLGNEIQKWREQLQTAMSDNLDLAKKLHEATSAKKEEPVEAEKKISEPTKYLTDEEKSDYEGMIGVISKVAKAVFEEMGGTIGGSVSELKKKVESLTVEQIANQFVNSVEALAPGFRVANGVPELGVAPQDQEWIRFLSNNNEITGRSLGEEIMMLQDQNARIRASANAFNSYLKSKAPAAKSPAAVADAVPQRRKSSAQNAVVEDKARTTGPKSYTMQEWSELMKKARELGIGHGVGREMYDELLDAARTGRLTK